MTGSTQHPHVNVVIAGPTSAGSTTLLRRLVADLAEEARTDTVGETLPDTPEGGS